MQTNGTITPPRLTVQKSDKCTSILFIVKEINESGVIMKGGHLNNMVLLWKGIVRPTGPVQENYSGKQNTAFLKRHGACGVFGVRMSPG